MSAIHPKATDIISMSRRASTGLPRSTECDMH